METFERVETFGKDRIKAIFANLLVEDFQQEYECLFVDETTAWISWAEIQMAQDQDLNFFHARCRDSKVDDALDLIDKFREAMKDGEIENVFAGGMDIGRTRNLTEIGLVGKSNLDLFPLRLMISLDNCDFDSQETVLNKVMTLPITKFFGDKNGENAEKKYYQKFEGVDFTNATKELWATQTKMLFQQRKTRIPVDRDLAYQIHSIKKKVTAAKNNVFDTDRNEKHHADKFWMLALALSAANTKVINIPVKKTKSRQQYW
jgi:phage FluMu gp28-like protein